MAVMAEVPEEKVAKEIPIKMKMTSVDRIDRLIAQALRGIPVRHLPTPPAEIPVQPGRSYFQIEKQGEHWDAVKAGGAMSVFIPPEFTNLKAELMAVKDS
jgi:type VI secretion system protein ImpJ